MQVPISQLPGAADPQSGPSETNLLMALAEMHRQGRVSRPSDDRTPSSKPRKSKTAEGPF